jgi:hypothetical protein
MYSKIGMMIAPLGLTNPIRINLWKVRKLTWPTYFGKQEGDG